MDDPLSRACGELAGAGCLSRFRLTLIAEPDLRFPVSRQGVTEAVAALGHQLLRGFDREVVGAVYLDAARRPQGYTVAYVGTLTRVAVEPRGLLVPALLANAARFVLFHNHPSGDLEPTGEDLLFTRRLAEAGDLVGVELLDHVILGEAPHFFSLRAHGRL